MAKLKRLQNEVTDVGWILETENDVYYIGMGYLPEKFDGAEVSLSEEKEEIEEEWTDIELQALTVEEAANNLGRALENLQDLT